jgi:hypothetical protein
MRLHPQDASEITFIMLTRLYYQLQLVKEFFAFYGP